MANFGDLVVWNLDGLQGEGYISGEMAYSEDGSVVLLTTEEAIGMPINVCHCRPIASGHIARAGIYRDRYEARFPGQLKALPVLAADS